MKWLAPSYNQRPCFSFIFPGVSIDSFLLLYFLPDIWLFPRIVTTCLALSFGVSVHMAAFAWLGTQLFCSVPCTSLPVVAHGWLWSNLDQASVWSFKHCFRSLDPLIWHPEYLHTDQNEIKAWSPGLVFLCVATVAFREYPALLVWGGTGTLCKLYLSVPKCFMETGWLGLFHIQCQEASVPIWLSVQSHMLLFLIHMPQWSHLQASSLLHLITHHSLL